MQFIYILFFSLSDCRVVSFQESSKFQNMVPINLTHRLGITCVDFQVANQFFKKI